MNRTPPDQATPHLKHWAAAQLSLKPDTLPGEARAAFLRHLNDDEFVPSWRRQQAALYLARPTEEAAQLVLGRGQAQADEEDRLREEVDRYAAEFFELKVGERRQRFRELFTRCSFCPPLTSRLRALAPGLDVTPVTDPDPRVAELGQDVLLMFTLRPEARIARRQALLRQVAAQPGPWQEAAQRLSRTAPAVAALVPGLMDEVIRGDRPRWRKRFRRPVAGTTVPAGTGGGGSGGGNPWRFSWLLIVVVIGLIRAMSSGVGSSSRPAYMPPTFPSYQYSPYFTIPTAPFDQDEDIRKKLRDLDRFRRSTEPLSPEEEELRRALRDLEKIGRGTERAPTTTPRSTGPARR